MRILASEKDVNWAPIPNVRSWILDDNLPPIELVSAVFGLVFDENDQIILIKNKRGWGLPGGHVEKGESLEQALRREVLEETDCAIEIIKSFGYQKLEHFCQRLDNYHYPFPIGCIVYYLAKLKYKQNFDLNSPFRIEVSDRKLVAMHEAYSAEGIKDRLAFIKEAYNLYKLKK